MNLFQAGDFQLASGRRSRFKLDCDAMTPVDWNAVVAMLLEVLPPFRQVVGVPGNGELLADGLRPFGADDSNVFLVVDDVWTTGASMEATAAQVRQISDEDWGGKLQIVGAVLFSRGPHPDWVVPLFVLNPKLWSK